jgi:hypothetical protein
LSSSCSQQTAATAEYSHNFVIREAGTRGASKGLKDVALQGATDGFDQE